MVNAPRARLRFIKPQEPLQVLEPPVSDDWVHEIKYDGFRTQIILDWAGVRAFTKNGFDWSKRYWPIVAAAEKLPAKSFILDGEMIAPDADGRPNFHEMHSRMAWNAEQLAFVAFDIMHLDGEDLRSKPLLERKDILWNLVKPADGIIQFSQHVAASGVEFFAAVEKMGLEGMVSKRPGSSYKSGASEAWLKTKCWETDDFDLVGIKRVPGRLPVGIVARDGKYAGSPTITLSREMRDRLRQLVRKARAAQPAGVPNAVKDPTVEWIKPGSITANVRFLRNEPKLRHGILQGFKAREAGGK